MIRIIYITVFIIFIAICIYYIFYTDEQYLNKYGTIYTLDDKKFKRPVNTPLNPLTIPYSDVHIPSDIILPNFLTYKYPLITPIQDQGTCGSCWSFVIGEVLANRIMILTNGKHRLNLSAQQLLNCYNPLDGCNGIIPEKALLWLENTQTPLTSDKVITYKQSKSDTILDKCINVNIGIKIRKGSIRTLTTFIPTEKYDVSILNKNILNMKKELFLKGPFYSVIEVYDDFYSLSSTSVYKPGKDTSVIGGHGILIIGYCDPGIDQRFPNDGYWIAKNIWGLSWPVDIGGFFYIKMGYNICGVESRCQSADPNISNNTIDIEKLRYTNINPYIKFLKKPRKN